MAKPARRKRRHSKPDALPLTPHPRGYWCKRYKITGTTIWKMAYFGRVADDPDGKAAVAKWLAQKDYLLNGLSPPEDPTGLTIKELVNRFLDAKVALIRTGELSERTFRQYDTTAGRIVGALGPARLVAHLTPTDFGHLRSELAAGRGPVALGNEITVARMVFKFAYDEGFIDRPLRYGQSFDRPSRKTLRVERARRGSKMFEASDLRAILDAAKVPMKAFVLLGINAGLGATDIADMPEAAIDLRHGWVDYARGKTGIGRRIPLWPETLAAIQEAIQQRPKAKAQADRDVAFLTRFGTRWVKLNRNDDRDGATPDDAIGKEFNKLLIRLAIKRPGLRFYGLRHTFRTIADETKDQPAARAIMGHHDNTMDGVYRERISDERLRAVVDHVRDWLFAPVVKASGQATAAGEGAADDLQAAIQRVQEAIAATSGPTRHTLESVWQPDVERARAGDAAAQKKLVSTWGGPIA